MRALLLAGLAGVASAQPPHPVMCTADCERSSAERCEPCVAPMLPSGCGQQLFSGQPWCDRSKSPAERAAAIVKATTFYDDPKVIADVSRGLGDAMVGINVADLPAPHRLAERGW